MSLFPLFDQIYRETHDKDLSTSQKKTFISKMKKIDNEGMQLLFALISVYQEKTDISNRIPIPYGGQKIGGDKVVDIEYNMDTIPNHLRQILHKFVLLHIKRIVDEQNFKRPNENKLSKKVPTNIEKSKNKK